MLKLYGGARSRASIVQWYLEELGVPYEFVLLDMQAGEHLEADYTAIQPFGKVPAIVDGEFTLWESGAILLYLAEKHGGSASTIEQRSQIAQWILFANATMGPEVFSEATRDRSVPRLFTPLNHLLEHQTFLLGDQFSAADVAVGALLAYIPLMLKLDLSSYPAVVSYTKRLAERPAYQKTIGSR